MSIDSQVKELKELAQRLNLSIFEIITESKSAKIPGRPLFNTLMNKIHKGEIAGILCWKLDRLARNPIDGSVLVWALDQGKISEIVTPHGNFKNNSNDKFLMQIEFGMAKKYVDDLSDNVKRGNKAKLEKGWLPNLPPLGYLNEPKERTIVQDPERFSLLRRMWDLLLQGVPVAKILETANQEWGFRTRTHKKLGGKPLTLSGLYRIFSNSFYYGLIERKDGVFQGRHDPVITEEEYWKAQEILGKIGKSRPKKRHFPFTGLIRCGECGCMITAEENVNRYGYHYTYYRCSKKNRNIRCSQEYIRDMKLEDQIRDYFQKIYVPELLFDLAVDHLRHEEKEDHAGHADIENSLANAVRICRKQLDNLNQMRLRDLISDEEYLVEKKRLIVEKIKAEGKLNDFRAGKTSSFSQTQNAFLFAHQCIQYLEKGSLEEKKSILTEIGSNFLLKCKTLSIDVEKPYRIIEEGLKKIYEKIGPLQPENQRLNTGEYTLSGPAILSWRRGWDSNPRPAFRRAQVSNLLLWTAQPPLQNQKYINKSVLRYQYFKGPRKGAFIAKSLRYNSYTSFLFNSYWNCFHQHIAYFSPLAANADIEIRFLGVSGQIIALKTPS